MGGRASGWVRGAWALISSLARRDLGIMFICVAPERALLLGADHEQRPLFPLFFARV